MKRALYLSVIFILAASVSVFAQKKEDAVEVEVDSLQATPVGVSVTLREHGAAEELHMMVGFTEGRSIAEAIGHQEAERPSSYDLIKAFMDRNGWRVKKVLIRTLNEGTYKADMTIENDHESQIYDCRPSDAMAVGLRYNAKIYVNRQVFEEEKKENDPDHQGGDQEKEPSPDQLTL